jgi:hypothetical protein
VVIVGKNRSRDSSHALTAKAKKITKILRCRNQQKWMVFSEADDKSSPKAQISGGEAALMFKQGVERKAQWEPRSFTEDNAFHQFIRNSYGRGGGVGRILGVGANLGVGEGLGVKVGVAVGVSVAVGDGGG